MSLRKELNLDDAKNVAGGSVAYDVDNRHIYIGVKGAIREFEINPDCGLTTEQIKGIIGGSVDLNRSNDLNDAATMAAIAGFTTEIQYDNKFG